MAIVERYNKESNRHIRALTDCTLPFGQRILNSNHSDRSKIPAAQMLFCNTLNLGKGIFLPLKERPVSIRPSSLYASEMLAMQKNLLEKSAAELSRTDLLHVSTKEFSTHKDYLPGSFVLVHYRSGAPPSLLHTY